ncbi:MAG: putative ABC transporter ATP-binding protein YbhF [candidate division BRC1 bacterium ADurb.BinA364]|nr:MAG: putative ABC transporter ATP-binding protein YbhF [candidate division BRC1 bacterium ADurb.BinA364]
MLATLLRPTAGSAEICNYNVLTQANDVKRVIGYMPDFFGVYDDMKVWEYLDFFAAAYKIEKARRETIINDVLELTDLTGKREDYVEALSRGMKQRLCLAKTLVHDPQVLLLDEPASGLDPRARIELRELLKELRRMGKTILISSHILTELSDFCNSIGIIERGRLRASGQIEDIKAQLALRRVIVVEVRAEPEKAHDALLERPEVKQVEVDGNRLSIEIDAETEDTSFIFETLVSKGCKVISVKERESNLEDIFMKITDGAVQ